MDIRFMRTDGGPHGALAHINDAVALFKFGNLGAYSVDDAGCLVTQDRTLDLAHCNHDISDGSTFSITRFSCSVIGDMILTRSSWHTLLLQSGLLHHAVAGMVSHHR